MVHGKLQTAESTAESKTTATPSALFDRFARGDLDVYGYLDARVDEAIAPLAGKLPAERIAWLRQMLRDQLLNDPVLSERVRQATGRDARST